MNLPTLTGPAPTGSAPTGTTPTAGRTGATEGGDAPAGFTALLVDALAGEVPDQVLAEADGLDPEAITELAAAMEDLASPADAAGTDETTEGDATAEALAAVLLAGSAARPDLVAAVRAWQQQGAGEGDTVSGPNADTPTAGPAADTPTTGPVADRAHAAGTSATTSTTDTEALPTATSRAATPASASRPAEAAAGVEPPSRPSTATPTLPDTAADRARLAVAEAPARVAVDGGEAPAPPPTVAAPSSSTAAPAAASPAPTAPDTSLHARLVNRVIQAAEALEHAPPPRTMVVELPDGEGLRLQVSLRGTEVHVQFQGAAGQGTDLGAWGRELAAGLAGRGMSLGEFQTGSDADRGRGQGQPAPDDLPADDDRTPRRRADRGTTDGALRL